MTSRSSDLFAQFGKGGGENVGREVLLGSREISALQVEDHGRTERMNETHLLADGFEDRNVRAIPDVRD